MMIRPFYILALLFITGYVSGQNSDFGMWYGAGTSIKILKNTELGVSSTFRANQNVSRLDQFFFDGSISYKFNKYVSVAASYRHIFKNESDNGFFNRYRYYTDLKLTYPFYNFKLSNRFRYQGQFKQYAEKPQDKLPDYFFRSKAQLYYNWPFSPINPFVAMEWFWPVIDGFPKFLDQKRFSLGVQYKINKHQSFEPEYIFQREYGFVISDIHIISFSYNYEF